MDKYQTYKVATMLDEDNSKDESIEERPSSWTLQSISYNVCLSSFVVCPFWWKTEPHGLQTSG